MMYYQEQNDKEKYKATCDKVEQVSPRDPFFVDQMARDLLKKGNDFFDNKKDFKTALQYYNTIHQKYKPFWYCVIYNRGLCLQ